MLYSWRTSTFMTLQGIRVFTLNDREAPRFLKPVDRYDGAILVQGSVNPVLLDDWPDGVDYVCGHCKGMLIASGVADDQLWDVAFECFRCKGLSTSPSLPPGMALPPNFVMIDPSRIVIAEPIQMRRAVVTGRLAFERRTSEAGRKGTTFGDRREEKSRDLGSSLLQGYLEKLRDLLGPTFDRLHLSDELGIKSPTPPARRHPLMVIVKSAQNAIESFATNSPVVDVRCVSELHVLIDILDRWRNHLLWSKIIEGLDNEYSHTVMTIVAASFLEDMGNGVILHQGVRGRAPDLLLVVGAQQRAAVEIKAPTSLRWRSADLSPPEAGGIVSRATRKAGTGTKGQLARAIPGLLVIGGFHLSDPDLGSLEAAAAEHFRRASKAGRSSHLAVVVIVSLSSVIGVVTVEGVVVPRTIKGSLSVRIAGNPGYQGSITLNDRRASSRKPGIEP